MSNMEDRRIRYIIQHPETKKIAMMDFCLDHIEDNDISWIFDSFEHKFCCGGWCEKPCEGLFGDYEIIERDLSSELKDKNGKEIFERDIIKFDNDPHFYEVSFEKGCFRIKNLNIKYQSILYVHNEYCEVVGTIYQNHELLEIQK